MAHYIACAVFRPLCFVSAPPLKLQKLNVTWKSGAVGVGPGRPLGDSPEELCNSGEQDIVTFAELYSDERPLLFPVWLVRAVRKGLPVVEVIFDDFPSRPLDQSSVNVVANAISDDDQGDPYGRQLNNDSCADDQECGFIMRLLECLPKSYVSSSSPISMQLDLVTRRIVHSPR